MWHPAQALTLSALTHSDVLEVSGSDESLTRAKQFEQVSFNCELSMAVTSGRSIEKMASPGPTASELKRPLPATLDSFMEALVSLGIIKVVILSSSIQAPAIYC